MNRIIRIQKDSSSAVFGQIAALHMETIHHGVLPELGYPFLTKLYRYLATIDGAFIFAALGHRDKLCGFIAGSVDIKKCSRKLLLLHGIPLFCSANLSVRVMKRALAVLRYPLTKRAGFDSIGAELLSIAICRENQRTGLGKQLTEQLEEAFKLSGSVNSYQVATNIEDKASNAFYVSQGFQFSGAKKHHDLTLALYHKTLIESLK